MIVAIDPDVDASGVCELRDGYMLLFNLPLWGLFEYIKSESKYNDDLIVLVEQSKSTSTWHKGGKGAARQVGRNYEISNQIVKFCEAHGIKYKTIEPQGYSSVTHENFNRIVKQNFKRTNAETRVAGLIAYNYKKGVL